MVDYSHPVIVCKYSYTNRVRNLKVSYILELGESAFQLVVLFHWHEIRLFVCGGFFSLDRLKLFALNNVVINLSFLHESGFECLCRECAVVLLCVGLKIRKLLGCWCYVVSLWLVHFFLHDRCLNWECLSNNLSNN